MTHTHTHTEYDLKGYRSHQNKPTYSARQAILRVLAADKESFKLVWDYLRKILH